MKCKSGLLVLAVFLASCFSSKPEPQLAYPYKDESPVPIAESGVANKPLPPSLPDTTIQIIIKMNQSADATWQKAIASLRKRELSTTEANRDAGRIQTAWIPLKESICDTTPVEGMPLPCKVRYAMAIDKIGSQSSSFSISYEERCEYTQRKFFRCPMSEAEKLMREIAMDASNEEVK